MCWEKQPRNKSTPGTLISCYRKQNKTNNKNIHCVFFSPFTFTALQSLEAGLAHFPSGSSKQKYIPVCSIPHPGQAREPYVLCVGAGHAADVAGTDLARHPAPWRARGPSRQHGLPAARCSQAIRSSQVPAVQKALEVEMIFFFFPFPCTNLVSVIGHAPSA